MFALFFSLSPTLHLVFMEKYKILFLNSICRKRRRKQRNLANTLAFFLIKKLLASLPSNFDLSDDAFSAVEARGLVCHVPASGDRPLSLLVIRKLITQFQLDAQEAAAC